VVTDTESTFALVGAPYLEYLPVVDLSSGRLLGMEALVRWLHPSRGLISPDQLIPDAEASGDIVPLTRWVLMEACEQAHRWSSSIQLGVNCTVEGLRRGEVSKAVAAALEQTGFRSGQLTLEVTEDAIVDSSAAADLGALSQMGVQLSVDDVGTNWSSFEPFKNHSIGTVKIDGSFIAGLEPVQGINRLVVETVIHMAHSLGMSAIVECVETLGQVQIVRAFDADAAQGFFFAPPMSSDDAAAFAAGPEIPQFSRTEVRTLVAPSDHSIDLGFRTETTPAGSVEDEPSDVGPDEVVGDAWTGAIGGSTAFGGASREDGHTPGVTNGRPAPTPPVRAAAAVPEDPPRGRAPLPQPAEGGEQKA
jgi:EAL domain-containing protein (putative c-di-GMP-specific phosphodiesterase class I)